MMSERLNTTICFCRQYWIASVIVHSIEVNKREMRIYSSIRCTLDLPCAACLQIRSDACEDFLLINQHGLLECLREIPLIIACGSLTLARATAQAWVRCEQP